MIICSDPHLGLESDSIDVNGVPSKVEDTKTRIVELIEYSEKTKQSIIVLGDVFESVDPKSYIHSLFLYLVNSSKQPIYIISGNHDCNIKWTSLLVGKNYESYNLKYYLTPTFIGVEGFNVLFIPHIPRKELDKAGGQKGYLEYIKEGTKQTPIDIVMSHALVNRLLNMSDTVAMESNNALLFDDKTWPKSPLYILGHEHNHQIINRKKYKIIIPGSIIMNDFSERNDIKGFVEIKKDKEPKFIEFKSKVHDYKQIKIDLVKKNTFIIDDKKVKVIENKLLKVIVNTNDRSKVNELRIREEIKKYNGVVVRFEIVVEKKENELIKVETKKIFNSISPEKLTKNFIDRQEVNKEIKQLANKVCRDVILGEDHD